MQSELISPLDYIHPSAQLGEGVKVHPFAYIDKDVRIGAGTVVMAHSSILEGAQIGEGNYIYQGAVIGATPQSFRYQTGHRTNVVIGNGNRIRENVVIAGGLDDDSATVIGNDCFLMDGVHICHDVHVHDACVLGIGAQVAGDCRVNFHSILSSGVIVQHKARIGRYSLVQSGVCVQKDVPPYLIIGGHPAGYHGVNAQILQKAGMDERMLRHVTNAYRMLYSGGDDLSDVILKIKEQIPQSPEIEVITNFLSQSTRGIVRREA